MRLQLALAVLLVTGVAAADPAPDPVPADPDITPTPEKPAAPEAAPAEPITGTARAGVYRDSDNTSVTRLLAVVAHAWDHWSMNASIGVDAVTSASVDVRSSPQLSKVDTITSASGTSSTSGGEMTDTRYQGTAGVGYKDGHGHAANLTTAVAHETDYFSVSGGLNGAYDLDDRTITLLGGVTFTDNQIASVLDPTLQRKMFAVGWTLGSAFVVTRDDALRVRYDGKLMSGYLASPYRSVRFGDWTAQLGAQQITFSVPGGGVIETLPDRVPDLRVGHAIVGEWVHSLAPGVGVHPEVRLGHDSFGIDSLTAGASLRLASDNWRLQAGYRFYLQSRASFFEDKYMQSASAYTYFTSDKELGSQIGHLGSLDISHVIADADGPGDTRLLFTAQLDAVHYRYPGFLLLPSRDSVFVSFGLSWEP